MNLVHPRTKLNGLPSGKFTSSKQASLIEYRETERVQKGAHTRQNPAMSFAFTEDEVEREMTAAGTGR
jgi:hypothetical protein